VLVLQHPVLHQQPIQIVFGIGLLLPASVATESILLQQRYDSKHVQATETTPNEQSREARFWPSLEVYCSGLGRGCLAAPASTALPPTALTTRATILLEAIPCTAPDALVLTDGPTAALLAIAPLLVVLADTKSLRSASSDSCELSRAHPAARAHLRAWASQTSLQFPPQGSRKCRTEHVFFSARA